MTVTVTVLQVGEGLQDHPAITAMTSTRVRDGMSEIKPWVPWIDLILACTLTLTLTLTR